MMRTLIHTTSLFILILLLMPYAKAQNPLPEILNHYDRHWEIKEDLYRVMKNGQVGIIKSDGTVVVPCVFNQVWNLDDEGFIRVLRSGKAGLYHIDGNIVIPAEYDQIWPFENDLAKVMKHGKLGYFNKNGEQVIPVEYQQIWAFEDGLARVLKNGKVGYVDEAGHEIIPCDYQQIWSFSDGQARVLKEGKVGYIDRQGNEIISPIFTHIWPFTGEKAKALHEGKMVWIDSNGHLLDLPIEQQELVTERPGMERDTTVEISKQAENESGKTISIFGNDITIHEDEDGNAVEFGISNNWEDRHYKWQERQEKKHQKWQDKQSSRHDFYANKSQHKHFKGHFSGVDIGFNSYVTRDGSLSLPEEYQYLDLNQGKSVGVSVNFLQYSIGLQRRGNIGLVTGLGLEFNNYRYDSQNLLTKDENGNLSYETTDRNVRKNKLTTIYFNMPLLLEFQIPTYRKSAPIYFSAGGIGGVRLKSHTKVVYNEGGKKKEKERSNYNLNTFRYGVMARMGYRAINLYGSYYFSSLFETNKGPELYPVSVGFFIYLDY